MSWTLFGVGVGPGDPVLMTLKAVRLIEGAQVVAYPTLEGAPSFARQIAAGRIAPGTREIAISVPMQVARGPAQAAYDAGAVEIAKALRSGQDVVCLCEGDRSSRALSCICMPAWRHASPSRRCPASPR